MVAPAPDGEGALARIVAWIGGGTGLDPHLDDALAALAEEHGAQVAVVYLGDPAAGGMALRSASGGDGPGRRPSTGIRPGSAPGVCDAMSAGREVAAGDGLDAELGVLGLPGGRLIPTRVGGRTVSALGLAPARPVDGAADRDLRATAHLLGLALRNGQLASGFRDRVRELDRQAVQLGALTEIARRVAGSLEQAEAQRVVVAEARALVRADSATLFAPGRDGALAVVATEGAAATDPPQHEEVVRAYAGGAGRRRGRRAVVAVPAGEGPQAPPLGVIAVARARGEPFDDDDLERLRGLADQAAIALANARLLADLRREQRERRSLSAAIVLAQEQERRRIAEDLHDGPVQELVGVGLLLDALAGDVGDSSPGAAEDVHRAAAAAREAVRGLRRAIADLHPLVLEQLGFAAAVRSLLERLEWSGVTVTIEVDGAADLTEAGRTVAFRCVQEAVANAARHAAASAVAVRAVRRGGSVVVTVTDDGRGFDPARPRPGVAEGHLGLAAVDERARLAGGELSITSAPGRGTTIRVTLPAATAGEGQSAGAESRATAAERASSSAKRSSTTT